MIFLLECKPPTDPGYVTWATSWYKIECKSSLPDLDCPYVRRMNRRRWPKIVPPEAVVTELERRRSESFQIWQERLLVSGSHPFLIATVAGDQKADCPRRDCWRTLSISPLTQIGWLPVLSGHNKAPRLLVITRRKVSVSSSLRSKQRSPQQSQRAPWP